MNLAQRTPEMRRRRGGRVGTVGLVAAMLAGALLAEPAWACALEGDDAMLQRSALNFAYPGALGVAHAVSLARRNGQLDRWRGLDEPASDGERRAQGWRIWLSLAQLRARLAPASNANTPALSIVLIEPMMWNRLAFEPATGKHRSGLALDVHSSGPVPDDVVAVTDEPVIERLNSGRLTAGEALELGLVRLYGRPSQVDAVRAWLARGDAQAPGLAAN